MVSNKCCYDHEAYSINTTIYSSMSEDGCVKTALDCVEETPGIVKTVLSVKNYCEKYATKDQLEEIKEILLQQMEEGSGCQGEKMEAKDDKEEHKVILIGPSLMSYGKSEVLSLPDLTPLDCNIPILPGVYFEGYVGRSTSDGVLMCGGDNNNDITSSCYLLTSSGYQEVPGLIHKRESAASVVTPLGLWVTGGYNGDHALDSTEIWSNNQSRPHVRLPEALLAHCLTTLNKTHVLLTGGYTESGVSSAAAYIYSDKAGFTRIEDMKTARSDHGCSVINDSTVIVAGGQTDDYSYLSSTEYLDLTSLTWSHGPEVPRGVWPAQILGPEVLGPEIGGHLLIGQYSIFKLEEEDLTQTRHWTHSIDHSSLTGQSKELNGPRLWAGTFVVDQNMFC